MLPNNPTRYSENGNVFLFILLGVILFAALAFVMSRGFRSDTTTAMSERQAELVAVDILSYAQQMEHAVAKIQQKGVSENDLSFDNEVEAGYNQTPDQPDAHNIFLPAGGGMSWQNPAAHANDGSPWLVTGNTCVVDVGTGGTGCDGDSLANEELLLVLPNVNANVCAALDQKTGIGAIPDDSGSGYSPTKFTGAFADGTAISIGSAHNAGCYTDGTNYIFYYTLIAR